MEQLTIGFAMCGSFCTFAQALPALERLTEQYRVLPILSETAAGTDTRFGSHEEHMARIVSATGREPILTIAQAEPIGPQKLLDVLVVAPCTGNTLAKLTNGITDSVVTMACKAHLRNGRPLVLALATNDGLGANAQNIGQLLTRRNVYFVPFGQDDPYKKQTSLVADFDRIEDTLKMALAGEQIQPILLRT